MMQTLRARLFVGLTALIFLFGLCAGVFSYRWSFDEAIELQDAILVQVVALTAVQGRQPPPASVPAGTVDKEAQVHVQELDELGGLLPAGLTEGLHTVTAGGEIWRVAVRRRDDGSRIAAAQRTDARDEIARDAALRTLYPLAGLIPCLMLVVAGVIHLAFRPLAILTRQLETDGLETIPRFAMEGLPGEITPFVTAISRLLERLERTFLQQRRFIANAAHELRSPVTAISLQAQNIDEGKLDHELQRRFGDLKSGIARISRLLEQLLISARYENEHTDEVDAVALDTALMLQVGNFMAQADDRGVDLGFDRIEPVTVRVGTTALQILARNLIENALHHSPTNGRVDISVYPEDGRGILRIEDMGGGIPSCALPRLFEPFFRGPNAVGEGNGLGLSIVRQIADGCGATIALANIERSGGTGLRVTVSFARAAR